MIELRMTVDRGRLLYCRYLRLLKIEHGENFPELGFCIGWVDVICDDIAKAAPKDDVITGEGILVDSAIPRMHNRWREAVKAREELRKAIRDQDMPEAQRKYLVVLATLSDAFSRMQPEVRQNPDGTPLDGNETSKP